MYEFWINQPAKLGKWRKLDLVMVGLLQQPFPMEEIQRTFRMEAFCLPSNGGISEKDTPWEWTKLWKRHPSNPYIPTQRGLNCYHNSSILLPIQTSTNSIQLFSLTVWRTNKTRPWITVPNSCKLLPNSIMTFWKHCNQTMEKVANSILLFGYWHPCR